MGATISRMIFWLRLTWRNMIPDSEYSSLAARRKPKTTRRAWITQTHGRGRYSVVVEEDNHPGKRLKEARIWQEWPSAGTKLCTHGNPVVVKDKTLHVEAYSPVWVSKFAYFKWDIIKRVNLMAEQELISDIYVTLAQDEPHDAE